MRANSKPATKVTTTTTTTKQVTSTSKPNSKPPSHGQSKKVEVQKVISSSNGDEIKETLEFFEKKSGANVVLKSFNELLCPWDSPGENTGVGCDALLQEIFLTQGSNPCLTVSPALAGRFFTTSATWEALLWSICPQITSF